MKTNERTGQIWQIFHKDMKAFILSRIHDEEAANDILQEAFIRIHRKIDTLKDDAKLKPWIFQITRNLIIDHYRKVRNTENEDSLLEDPVEYQESDFMSEAVDDMIHMMDELPAEYCDALCLTEIEGISHKEYAERAGISYTLAKTRVHRARKMLKDMLMKCCHYQFDKYGTVLDISPSCCCCQVEKGCK